MFCNFLETYTIPRIENSTVVGGEPAPVPTEVAYTNGVATEPQQEQLERSRYTGNSGIVPPVRPLKRKHANEGPDIAETSSDGKLVMFEGRDASYPDELNQLIHPLRCELCKSQMNSLVSARDHYKSKPHDSKISAWLKKNFTEKGLEPPAIKRFLPKGPAGPDAYHCRLCDLKLTSLTHANQHYAGRKHRMVAERHAKPSGAGFYNEAGEWVRTATKVSPKGAGDNRFGIGEAFVQPAAADETPTGGEVANNALHCAVCDVYTTSAQQMETHLTGSKHAKKLKAQSVEPNGEAGVAAKTMPDGTGATTLLAACAKDDADTKATIDASTFRTPSGAYYCKTCDLNLINTLALQQHLAGKKHAKRSADEKDLNKKN